MHRCQLVQRACLCWLAMAGWLVSCHTSPYPPLTLTQVTAGKWIILVRHLASAKLVTAVVVGAGWWVVERSSLFRNYLGLWLG